MQFQNSTRTGQTNLGRVDGLWEACKQARSTLFLCLTPFETGGISKFYQMREVCKGGEGKFIGVQVCFLFQFGLLVLETERFPLQNFVTCVNVQHDCHKGNCAVTLSRRRQLERQSTGAMVGEVGHTDDRNYIINSAGFYSKTRPRVFAGVPLRTVDWQSQLQGLHEGLSQWHLAGTKTGPPMPVDELDPSLL
jgi:hypothetical protein